MKSAASITILQAAHGYDGFFFSGWRARKGSMFFLLNAGKSVEANGKTIFDRLQPEAMRYGS